MYKIEFSVRMKRDVKRMKKRGKDLRKLEAVLKLLAAGEALPQKYLDHKLTDNLHDMRECHIEPDWLLIYRIYQDSLVLLATATGSHADLFKM